MLEISLLFLYKIRNKLIEESLFFSKNNYPEVNNYPMEYLSLSNSNSTNYEQRFRKML